MNAEQVKIRNIIDMAFGFSAMTRVFKEESTEKIVNKLNEAVSQITYLKNEKEFANFHDGFCLWFIDNIKTAQRTKRDGTKKPSCTASYGQEAKVLDIALKVYVYYCHLPDPETAERITQWLNSAIDTKMMVYLKGLPGGDVVNVTSIEQVNENTYTNLQALVRMDIECNFPTRILPVQWDDLMWRKLNDKDKKNKK